jgi:hypothetical protein
MADSDTATQPDNYDLPDPSSYNSLKIFADDLIMNERPEHGKTVLLLAKLSKLKDKVQSCDEMCNTIYKSNVGMAQKLQIMTVIVKNLTDNTFSDAMDTSTTDDASE